MQDNLLALGEGEQIEHSFVWTLDAFSFVVYGVTNMDDVTETTLQTE